MSNQDKDKNLNRLHASLEDLSQAINFVKLALDRRFHQSSDPQDRLIGNAINTSIIISYWRPFSGNRGSDQMTKTLSDHHIRSYSEEQNLMHQKIKDFRNTIYAHTDDSTCKVRALPVLNDGIYRAKRQIVFTPLSNEELRLIEHMLNTTCCSIGNNIMKLQNSRTSH